ncbi:MAG TPA: glycosyltransferase family 2 protein [Patescibacteria group bacterium]
MKKTDLSIIIPTWNTAEITKKCIDTINSHLPDSLKYEIIIVDNNSTDNTSKIIPGLPNVVYIKNSANFGFSKGNNIGFKRAAGEYLLFLNSDMELTDSNLTGMLDFYRKPNLHIGVIGPQFLNPDLSLQASVFPPQTAINAAREYWLNIPKSYSKYQPDNNEPLEVDAISGGAILISAALFQKIGGWDERYFMYFEDLELCRKVRNLGYKIYFYPGMEVIHRHGASGQKLAGSDFQWRRLIPSSKIYHGLLNYYLISFILWSGQKMHKLFSKN